MATRFRKHFTRKMKARKGLKTRRHHGGFSFMKKSPLSTMQNTTMKKDGNMTSFLNKGRALLNKLTPQSMKNAQAFSSYLQTLEDQVKFKLSHEDRDKMKFDLMEQLREDGKILNEKRKMLGESQYKSIREKIDKIQNYIISNTRNNQ